MWMSHNPAGAANELTAIGFVWLQLPRNMLLAIVVVFRTVYRIGVDNSVYCIVRHHDQSLGNCSQMMPGAVNTLAAPQ